MVEEAELSFVDKFARAVTKCLDILCVVPLSASLTLPPQGEDQPAFTPASASEENDEVSASEENDEEQLLSAASVSIAESKPAAAASAAGNQRGSGGRGNGDGHLCDLNEWAVERDAAAQARLGAGNPDALRTYNPG